MYVSGEFDLADESELKPPDAAPHSGNKPHQLHKATVILGDISSRLPIIFSLFLSATLQYLQVSVAGHDVGHYMCQLAYCHNLSTDTFTNCQPILLVCVICCQNGLLFSNIYISIFLRFLWVCI